MTSTTIRPPIRFAIRHGIRSESVRISPVPEPGEILRIRGVGHLFHPSLRDVTREPRHAWMEERSNP